MGRAFQVLTLDEVVEINRRMIERFGGFYVAEDRNMANPGSLDHVLAEIQGSFFGHEPFPTILDKAAALGWRIIARHVFHDGNKRTGVEACRLLLDINGWVLPIGMEVVEIAVRIAEGSLSLSDFSKWLEGRVVAKAQPPP